MFVPIFSTSGQVKMKQPDQRKRQDRRTDRTVQNYFLNVKNGWVEVSTQVGDSNLT